MRYVWRDVAIVLSCTAGLVAAWFIGNAGYGR